MIDDGFDYIALPPTYEEPPVTEKDVRVSGALMVCGLITLVIAGMLAFALFR